MHAMTAHRKRRPEEKYVTKLAEHSYQCQFCKNKYVRFDLVKKHLIDFGETYKRYPDEEAGTDDSDTMNLSRRESEGAIAATDAEAATVMPDELAGHAEIVGRADETAQEQKR